MHGCDIAEEERTDAGAEAQAAASQPLANTSHYTVSYLKAYVWATGIRSVIYEHRGLRKEMFI